MTANSQGGTVGWQTVRTRKQRHAEWAISASNIRYKMADRTKATTAGDFCRRFNAFSIWKLMEVFNSVRLDAWRMQPDSFFDEAVIDADGTMVETTGECKEGMDINYRRIIAGKILNDVDLDLPRSF